MSWKTIAKMAMVTMGVMFALNQIAGTAGAGQVRGVIKGNTSPVTVAV